MIQVENHHPIDAFGNDAGHLIVEGQHIRDLAREFGTPLYIIDAGAIRRRIANLRSLLPNHIKLRYAIKANPHPKVLDVLAPLVDGFDVASAGELRLALQHHPHAQLAFAGPGKTDIELQAAVASSTTVNIESACEAHRLSRIADAAGKKATCRLRLDPGTAVRNSGMRMAGGPTQFGMEPDDAKDLLDQAPTGLDIEGFHFFPGSQMLDANAISGFQQAAIESAHNLWRRETQPFRCTLGGGFGIPYHAGQRPLDVQAVATGLERLASELPAGTLDLELGRYLVADAGVYVTRIVDSKMSHGVPVHIVDGGMHHNMAATGNLGQVVKRPFPLAVDGQLGAPSAAPTMVTGCLCTPMDVFCRTLPLPKAQPDDLVLVFRAGAYGQSASPSAFLSHGTCMELVL